MSAFRSSTCRHILEKLSENSDKHPFFDVAQNPDTTSWKSIQEYPLLGTQLLLARKIDADLSLIHIYIALTYTDAARAKTFRVIATNTNPIEL